jgi:hypothetical protein
MTDDFDEIEAALQRQEEAMALLERLRMAEPSGNKRPESPGGGRRDFRRWPAPEGLTVDLHDGSVWRKADCADIGIGGARLAAIPEWLKGPVPARLKTAVAPSVLVLMDVMWRDAKAGGVKFEFGDPEERDEWTAALIDALLARYSLA